MARFGAEALPERMFSMRWSGYWVVRSPGEVTLLLGADDAAEVRVDGRAVHRRDAEVGFATVPVRLTLTPGVHALEVSYEQQGGGAFFHLLVGRNGREPAPLDPRDLFPSVADAQRAPTNDRLDKAWAYGVPRLLAVLLALAVLRVMGAWRRTRAVDAHGARASVPAACVALIRSHRATAIVLTAVVVTALAAVLRLDALAGRYGPPAHPRWASALVGSSVGLVDIVRPDGWSWSPIAQPYVGGDPVNYLRFAREMQSFYQPHVREPVFLFTTRVFLAALGDQDVAVSFASALYSTLLVAATFLLAWEAFGPGAATVAALALGIERVASTGASTGGATTPRRSFWCCSRRSSCA